MWNSIVPACLGLGERRSVVATAVLAAVFGLGLANGNAFAQDAQDAPPPPPPQQSGQQPGEQPGPGAGRGMGHRPMESVDDQIKHLNKKLKLTDDQQAKLKPIFEDQHKQMDQLRSDSSLSREDRFSKMQEIRQNSDTQIKSVLTEDQQKNFDKMREEQKERMKQWRGGGNNAPPPAGGSPDSQ
jgi:periplasmic protein CpxP/Spy